MARLIARLLKAAERFSVAERGYLEKDGSYGNWENSHTRTGKESNMTEVPSMYQPTFNLPITLMATAFVSWRSMNTYASLSN
jgi:hypothetical protein